MSVKIRSLMTRERSYLEREQTFSLREQSFLAKESSSSSSSNIPRSLQHARAQPQQLPPPPPPGANKLVRMPTVCIGPTVEELQLQRGAALLGRTSQQHYQQQQQQQYDGDLPPIDMFSSRMQVRLRFVQTQRLQRQASNLQRSKARRLAVSMPELPTIQRR